MMMTNARVGPGRIDAARSVRGWAVAAIAAVALLAPLAAGQPLNLRLREAHAQARLGESKVGVMIVDCQTGDTLAMREADTQFIPASNMKLLTSGAALSVLGPDFVFRTELAMEGSTLIVRGAGDPAFGDPKLLKEMGIGLEDFFRAWVAAVATALAPGGAAQPVEGRAQVREIVIDARIFDSEWVHPTWPADQLNRWYCAEVSGLNFHTNVLSVFPSPGRSGQAPQLRIEPEAPWLTIENQSRTVKDGPNTVWIARPPASNSMKLLGNVRWAAEAPVDVSLHKMHEVFGRMFADRLEAAGLGRITVRVAGETEALPTGRTIAAVQTPIAVALRRCNTNSQNLYGEAMLKRLGHELTGQPGSWRTGAAAVRMVIEEKLGPRLVTAATIADGSGMSRENKVTPRLMASWLVAMQADERMRDAFFESLPVAGEGTLRRRFAGKGVEHEVRAKTGYLNGVSCLSGYVLERPSGRRVAFSVLVNDVPGSLPMQRVKDFQEAVARIADEWLGPVTASAPDSGG